MNTFLCNVFNYLSEKVDLGAGSKGGLPNEDDRIRYISQLVSLGVSAHSSVVNEHYEIPEPDAFMLKEFMPALVCRMVDDAIAACEQHAGLPKSKFDPPALPEVLENECAQKLLGLYVLRCVDKNDVGRIRDLLPALKIPGLQPAVFVSVVIALLNKVDIDTSNDVRLLLLEEMLIPSTQDSITNHVEVIGLIGHVLDSNTGVGASKVTELLKSTIDQGLKDDAGGDDSARLVKEYQNLVHKLSALEVSTSQLAFATQYIKMVEELASKSEDESEEEDEEEEELVVE
ncbi:hypothetical protein SARC_01134 [Sphaeroforma arctica JP610]|uniref:Uncharacterized protein n=1 Tax=Sphaeroforma arctica JP610 TaxID=667725 RepID=A0A0L0GCT1_9EUKA|nr:hypothetical protein SARC_01134 [Sphaeroforma arctica JP610]KNC86714.1 hypothetical protein SARC_01134 [Sphaeroforma arctica JP610]|eukprot:XP_014160616.1 hypothetical protein SARC_01134 [Sphaeroforma arctica JP610]